MLKIIALFFIFLVFFFFFFFLSINFMHKEYSTHTLSCQYYYQHIHKHVHTTNTTHSITHTHIQFEISMNFLLFFFSFFCLFVYSLFSFVFTSSFFSRFLLETESSQIEERKDHLLHLENVYYFLSFFLSFFLISPVIIYFSIKPYFLPLFIIIIRVLNLLRLQRKRPPLAAATDVS